MPALESDDVLARPLLWILLLAAAAWAATIGLVWLVWQILS